MQKGFTAFFWCARTAAVLAASSLLAPGGWPAESTELRPSGDPAEGAFGPILDHLRAGVSERPLQDWCSPLSTDRELSLGRFRRAIEKARRGGDAARCLRLDLRSLASHGAGEDFPERLWQAAADADWAERKFGRGVVDPAVCARLLSLCDELPPRHAYYIEGRFLLAKRLARAGDRAGEQEILGRIVATPNLPPDFVAPACRMLGASLEASGDYRGALDTYDLEEAAADRYSAAADCMLGAVLINLRLGNDDEAARLLRILQQAPPEVVRGADGASRIRELVALVATGQTPQLGLVRSARPIDGEPSAPSDAPAAIARWIRSISLGWYDYAGPYSLDAASPQNPALAPGHPEALLKPAEQIKRLLLAAQDGGTPEERRRESLREAVRRILNSASDYPRFNAIAASVIDNQDFDPETRRLTLESALAILAEAGRRLDYDSWRRDPLAKTFNAAFQGELSILDREAALDRTSAASILELAGDIRAEPMTTFGELTMGDLLGFLLRLGDLDAARKLASTVPSWPLYAGASLAIDSVRSDYEARIRQVDAFEPVHTALAAAVRARYPAAPAELPPEYRDLRLDAGLPARAPETTFQACRFLVETRQFDRGDLGFWGRFLQSLPAGADRPRAIAHLLRSGLGAATDDTLRSRVVALFFTSVDIDDPGVRGAVEAELAPYRDPARFPQSAFAIRLYEVQRDLRLGNPVAIESAFSDLDDPRGRFFQIEMGIRHYTQTGDREALRRTLSGLDSARLLSPGLVARTIPAYAVLGRDRRIALEAARRALRDAVLDSWLQHDEVSGNAALDLALAIDDPGALPPGWVWEMGTGPGDPLFQGRVQVVAAYLRRDWTQLEADARELNRAYPTSYSYYWYRGLALQMLGRSGEAAAALTTYTLHAHDELEYPRAVAFLEGSRS